jgi:hypothetical protein
MRVHLGCDELLQAGSPDPRSALPARSRLRRAARQLR